LLQRFLVISAKGQENVRRNCDNHTFVEKESTEKENWAEWMVEREEKRRKR
jgi:hypothetical protein